MYTVFLCMIAFKTTLCIYIYVYVSMTYVQIVCVSTKNGMLEFMCKGITLHT